MATLEDIARFLGLSKRAVRSRIDALGELLHDYVSRGARNRLIFRGEAVAILRRLEELRQQEGLPIHQAAERLRDELEDPEDLSTIRIVIQPDAEVDLLQQVVREVCRERDQWRDYAMALQAVLPPELKWLSSVSPPVSKDRRLN